MTAAQDQPGSDRESYMKRVCGLLLLCIVSQCSAVENRASGLLVGPGAASVGGAYTFYGTVDKTYTTSCGSAGQPIENDTTTAAATTTTSTTTAKEEEQTVYGIASYLVFQNGETLSLKYDYSTTREDFSFSPQNVITTTCQTDDLTTCISTGQFTCTTSDNLTCGGSYTFLFKNSVPVLGFQAKQGVLSWKKAFSLNGEGNGVDTAQLTFDLIGTDGSVFKGEIDCAL